MMFLDRIGYAADDLSRFTGTPRGRGRKKDRIHRVPRERADPDVFIRLPDVEDVPADVS